ncbi:MAG: DUF4399 domain-containing protein [Hyphomicrobiaceae bacterium]
MTRSTKAYATLNVVAITAVALAISASLAPSWASSEDRTKAPEGAAVYFITPENGATIEGPVTVRFGLRGLGVAPAGVEKDGTGHHHILINTKLEDYNNPIPADDQHRHFGGGQTEATLTLPAGTHTLQLVVGDHNHVPHLPPIESEVISITVK